MAFIPPRFSQPATPKPQYWPDKDYPLNGGLDLEGTEFELPENKTNKCLNVWFKNGELDKRWGQDFIGAETPEALGHSAYKYLFGGKIIKHTGTKLYSQTTLGVNTAVYSGLNNAKSKIFKFGDKLYLKQAGKYVQFDGTTATDVVPYIPTIIINRTPTGGGDLLDDYNRLGAGFKNSFNGTGAATAFTLTDLGLDVTAVTATVGGVPKVEGVDFTVNRATGIVTFGVAPALGTNNVIITAYKTDQADIDSILNCLSVMAFGGQNDNRLFFCNNGTGVYYWTGISELGVDPSYIPLNNFNIVGLQDENIAGFGRNQDILVVLKHREVYGVTYSFDGTTGVFSSFTISDVFGCDCPWTIQTVNNDTVFLSSEFGPCIVQSTAVSSQRNVFSIGRNINKRILKEADIQNASSVEYDGKYWLCVNNKMYLWDYFISPYYDTGNPDDNAKRLSWWYFENINAEDFIKDGDEFYHIERANGKTVKFIQPDQGSQYLDFGVAFNSIYRYPFRLIGDGLYEFTVIAGIIGVRGNRKTTYSVTYFTNDDFTGETDLDTIDVGTFAWNNIDWANHTWAVTGSLSLWPLRPTLKNIQYFAAEFSNNVAGASMNIQSMKWQYKIGRMIK
ncbi:MAG TPA: hypothetical protein VLS94_08950 [Fusibacter sp.]|nr:hypothetical protein [Fusibacter sp.]